MKKILPRNISSSMNAIQHPASPILRRIPSRYANKMLTPQQEITAMTIGKNTSPAPRSELSSTWLNARPILYSLGYQASYLVPEAVITLIIISIPPVAKALARVKQNAVEA